MVKRMKRKILISSLAVALVSSFITLAVYAGIQVDGPPPAGTTGTQEYDGVRCKPVSAATGTLSGTSPASASTAVGVTLTGLGPYRSMSIYAALTGATGGTLDVYLQYSPDGGTTWVDYAHFAQLAAGASTVYRVWNVSKCQQQTTIQTVGTGTSPALSGTTIIGGDWGDRLRVVYVAGASTSLGASQTILVTLTP